MVANKECPVLQMDVKSNFPTGDLREEAYVYSDPIKVVWQLLETWGFMPGPSTSRYRVTLFMRKLWMVWSTDTVSLCSWEDTYVLQDRRQPTCSPRLYLRQLRLTPWSENECWQSDVSLPFRPPSKMFCYFWSSLMVFMEAHFWPFHHNFHIFPHYFQSWDRVKCLFCMSKVLCTVRPFHHIFHNCPLLFPRRDMRSSTLPVPWAL